jgi:hypothetical protein
MFEPIIYLLAIMKPSVGSEHLPRRWQARQNIRHGMHVLPQIQARPQRRGVLVHGKQGWLWLLPHRSHLSQEAAAAALFSACKIEDTLKKSRDILCAAHNLKVSRQDHLSPDDPVCTIFSRTLFRLLPPL